MARPKTKESTLRTFRMDNTVGDRLDAYSAATQVPKTAVVEKAVTEYLDKVAPETAQPAAQESDESISD